MRRALWLAVVLLLGAPAVASAHAMLEATTPARGARLEVAPQVVEFRFDEPVEANFGALHVFDAHGRQVQSGAAFHPGGRGSVVAVRLRPALPAGGYTATYRVISADGHPASSGFVFSVGNVAGPGQSVDQLLAGSSSGPVTAGAQAAARGVQYGAIALGLGTLMFLGICWLPVAGRWPAAVRPFGRRTDRLLWAAVLAGLVSAAAAIGLEGATGLGSPVWSALRQEVITETLATRFGTIWRLGLVAWLVTGALLILRGSPAAREEGATRPLPPAVNGGDALPAPAAGNGGARLPALVGGPAPSPAATTVAAPSAAPVAALVRDAWLYALAVPLGALALLPALGGHGSEQPPVVVMAPANMLHVLAVSAWLGGIAVLVVALRTATSSLPAGQRAPLLAAVVGRFSTLATVALPVLLLTGTAQAIVEVRTFPHLLDTGFGRAVLIKILLAVGIAGLGYTNRSRNLPALRRVTAGGPPGQAGVLLRRALRAELTLGLGALAATGALSGYAPSIAASSGPFNTNVIAGPIRAEVTIDPAKTGPNETHLYLFDRRTGAPYTRTRQLTITAALPQHGISGLPLTPRVAGPGHYVIEGAGFGAPGDWMVTLTDRVSDFDQYETHFTVPIH